MIASTPRSTPFPRRARPPRKKLKDVNVTQIKKFYCARHQVAAQDPKISPVDPCVPKTTSPQLQERWQLAQKDPRYQDPEVQSYKFFALKGILVHDVLRALIHDVFLDLPDEIATPVDPATLCYALNWHAYHATITGLHRLRGKYPQVTVFDESLVHATMQDVQNMLGYLLAEIIPLLEKGECLGAILSRYTSIRLERDGVTPFKGLLIHYQPDWVRVAPEGIYVLDFKTGLLQPGQPVNDRDRVQVLLYAWCLSQHIRRPVKVAIFYTQCNVLWEAEFTKSMEQEAQQIVEEFHHYKDLEFNNHRQSMLVEILSTTIDLASVTGVSPLLLARSPTSRLPHPSS